MRYAQIFTCDVANGSGCRTSLFVSGCTHHCEGCFNRETWDFHYGKDFNEAVQDKLIEMTAKPYINGMTILGGEPMEVVNQHALRPFIERLKAELPDKTLWIYSGYTWEELTDPDNQRCHCQDTESILEHTDILVDGEFRLAEKDISLLFRGSANQRIIDVQDSLKKGTIIRAESVLH